MVVTEDEARTRAVRGTHLEAVVSNLLSGTIKMIRLLVIALSALMATTAATSASAGELTVKVAGRATAEVHADIVTAAKQLCQEDLAGNPFASDLAPYCVREVTREAVGRTNSPALVAFDRAQDRSVYFMRVAMR